MTEKVLPYDRTVVPQEHGWSCGPAATQVVLNSLGIIVSENELVSQIGTGVNGTDDISWIDNRALDRRVPQAGYVCEYITKDPPTKAQKDKLWRNVTGSINAGYGVVMNWVAPSSNYPRGVKGSQSPAYRGSTIFHYVACMGYDNAADNRALWIADSGFQPFGYWVSFDQAATLIAPKGYAYATGGVVTPTGRDANALSIIEEGRAKRTGQGKLNHEVISERGICIALSTALVESDLLMYANAGDPETLSFPHDRVGSDHDSSGLFQQRPPWWGSAADRMDPRRSAAMFYNSLSRLDYNSTSQSPGLFAQTVQQSAYPDRYDTRYDDAVALYARLVGSTKESNIPASDESPSRSIYRDNNNPILDATDALLNIDAMCHAGLIVEPAALRGELWAIGKVAALAAGKGPGSRLWFDASLPDTWAVERARYILALIERTNPDALKAYIVMKGSAV